MTGTIINAAVIVVTGLAGYLIKKAIPKHLEAPIMQMVGLSVILISLLGFLSTAITVQDGQLKTSGEILLLISLALGIFLGEIIKIDEGINGFGKMIEEKAGIDGFAKGFVSASILFCVGAMAIFGAIKDGISGDSSILLVKSVIDGITAFILSSTLGIGVCFAGISVFLYQGAIALLASGLEPFMTAQMISNICLVGYAIVITIGTNMLGITKIKTANMLPALVIPIVYTIFL